MHENLIVSLHKYQKKLEETEHSLFDLEEKYRQANATIKEKEFVISNLLKSGNFLYQRSHAENPVLVVKPSDNNIFLRISEKSLVERAFQLRTELESAASDVSNLFSKIGKRFMDQNSLFLLINVPCFINAVVVQKERTKLKMEIDISSKSSSHSSHNSLSYCIRLWLLR